MRILISKWDSQCDMEEVILVVALGKNILSGSFFWYITLSWEIFRIQRNGYHWRKGAQWKFPTTEEVVLNFVKYTRGSKLLLSMRRWKLSWQFSFKNGLEDILGNQLALNFGLYFVVQ